MNALKEAVIHHGIELPELADYRVRIPPGGRTEALVETLIRWGDSEPGATFTTVGVDSDQTAAAVIATEKMLNIVAHEAARAKRVGSQGG
jgi:D-citramalate synthase